MRRHVRVATIASVTTLLGLGGAERAAGAIGGTVLRQSDGLPLAGAVVTAAGPGQTPVTATTGADGRFSLAVGGAGPFGVGVQAAGMAAQSTGGVAADAELPPFTLSPATFTPLPLDVGPTNAIAADATSGIFYSLTLAAPELYRTTDHGGTWQQLTASYDDPDDGLRNTNSRNLLAVSAVSGEVAVGAEGVGVSYSKDYGVTWRRVGGADFAPGAWAPRRDPLLFWGHASPGAPSVLVFADRSPDGSWTVWRADMSSADPVWVKEPSDPFGAGSEIAHADSRAGSFVGRLSAAGGLAFAPLTPSGPFAFGPDEATGLPSPPRLLQLGGAKEEAAPPDAVLAVGGAPDPVVLMLTKDAGAAGFAGASTSDPTPFPPPLAPGCLNPSPVGATDSSVTPTSSGTTGAGSVGRCWVRKDGGGPLDFGNAGVSRQGYDASWGHDNFVAFLAGFTFGGANPGPLKYGQVDADGVPVVELEPADGGTGPGSGGFSLRGLTSAPVGDTAHGPGGNEQAAALTTDSLASKDGGQTMTAVLPRGSEWSNAVQWWRGSDGDWLLFGHAGRCNANDVNMLTALRNWNGETVAAPNVSGSKCGELGGPTGADVSAGPPYGVTSLQPVPGTDTLFIGLGSLTYTSPHHLYRATLTPGDPPSLTAATSIDGQAGLTLSNSPTAMAYCQSVAGDADVLLVALGTLYEHGMDVPGGLVRITGATSGAPAATLVDSIPHDGLRAGLADVRADCASGIVYAGGYGGGGPTHFFKSTDGGRTFARVDVPGPTGPPIPEVTAIGLNPSDPNDVKVADGSGTVVHTADGGATWTVVNDPAVSRGTFVNDIEYPPPGPGRRRAHLDGLPLAFVAQAPAPDPLLGTSGGAFRGDVAATEGVFGLRANPGDARALGVRISSLASDGRPVVLAPAVSVAGAAILERSTGLAFSVATPGGWSPPAPIPGTVAGDGQAAAVVGAAGGLHLAFARTTTAPGIYVTTLDPRGAWSPPRRLGTRGGDTLPAIAAVGTELHVAFLRTRGRARGRGILHAATRRGLFRRAVRVRRTTSADARVTLGGPALDTAAGRLQLVFARAGRRAGLYHASARGSRWSRLWRLTRRRGDAHPALAFDAAGARHVVFRRRGALLALRRSRRSRVRGAAAAVDHALVRSGTGVGLVFARATGDAPGIHVAQSTAGGRWQSVPRRLTTLAGDRNPSLLVDPQGRLTVLFERG